MYLFGFEGSAAMQMLYREKANMPLMTMLFLVALPVDVWLREARLYRPWFISAKMMSETSISALYDPRSK